MGDLFENASLFAVFDGHGQFGRQSSMLCKSKMPIYLKDHLLKGIRSWHEENQAMHEREVRTRLMLGNDKEDEPKPMTATTEAKIIKEAIVKSCAQI